MMCFRCEYRAKFLEGGFRPRYECGNITQSVIGCYMFKPCLPIILIQADKRDKRPWPWTGVFAARSRAVGICGGAKIGSIKVRTNKRKRNPDAVILVYTREGINDIQILQK